MALCLQPSPVRVVRVSVPQVVPSGINKRIHGIDFSPCCCFAPEQERRRKVFFGKLQAWKKPQTNMDSVARKTFRLKTEQSEE